MKRGLSDYDKRVFDGAQHSPATFLCERRFHVGAILVPFIIYWLVVFVVCYAVSEYAQRFLYDETTPWLGAKIGAGSFALAALLTYTRSSFDTMFTDKIGWTVLQAIVWFLVFMFVFRFHPLHAATIGVTTMLLIAGPATMAVQSFRGEVKVEPDTKLTKPVKPLRRPLQTAPKPPPGDPTKSQPEAAAPPDAKK